MCSAHVDPNRTNNSADDGQWLSIMDYAVKNAVSLSTLRRYIKANKVVYRKEQGKYYLLVGSAQDLESGSELEMNDSSAQQQVQMLQRQLNEAYEQINELKMLVAIYEEKLQGS